MALVNSTGRIMDAVIAHRLSHLLEAYHVLPSAHVGGRKMCFTELALYTATRKLYEAWTTRSVKWPVSRCSTSPVPLITFLTYACSVTCGRDELTRRQLSQAKRCREPKLCY
jgi:hypothetical protein